jgi:hypothetical protein
MATVARAILALTAAIGLTFAAAVPAQATADFWWHVDHSTSDTVQEDHDCQNTAYFYDPLTAGSDYLHFCVHLGNNNDLESGDSYDQVAASVNWYCVDSHGNQTQCADVSIHVMLKRADAGTDSVLTDWTSHCEEDIFGSTNCASGNQSSSWHEDVWYGPFNSNGSGQSSYTTPDPVYVTTSAESFNGNNVGGATTQQSRGEDCYPTSGCSYVH